MVKICGVRTVEHALLAARHGAAMLGVVFAPSRRQIEPEQVKQIRAALNQLEHAPELVGVFVNSPARIMLELASQCGLDVIQLSGDEPPGILAALPGRRVIKTVRLTGTPEEQEWLQPGAHHDRVRLHVDAHVAGSYGGAGVTADWAAAATLARQHAIILAGGLTPENVGQAIQQVAPWGVDVSSGVETDGQKDAAKIVAFLAAASGTTTHEYGTMVGGYTKRIV